MRNTRWNEVTPEEQVELWRGGGGHKVNGVFKHPKYSFSKTVSRVDFFFFWNVGLSFSCGRTKTEAFQNDHSMHVIQRKVRDAMVFHSLYHFVWQGKNDWHKLRVHAYFFENGEKILRCQTYLDTCGHERGVTFTVLFIATRYYLQLCLAFLARLPRTEPHTHRIRSTSFRLVVTWLIERTYLSIDCTGGVGETNKRKGMPWQIHISFIGHSQYGRLAAVKTG